jgi:hypothetical protein
MNLFWSHVLCLQKDQGNLQGYNSSLHCEMPGHALKFFSYLTGEKEYHLPLYQESS